jgi:hypothetical protein
VLGSSGTGPGVYGWSKTDVGVGGSTNSSTNAGVEGDNSGTGPAVHGNNTGGGIGVWGVTSTVGQGLANPAEAGSNTGGGAGLVGFTAGPNSIGLGGATDAGVGAYGSSQTGIGISGYTNTGVAEDIHWTGPCRLFHRPSLRQWIAYCHRGQIRGRAN